MALIRGYLKSNNFRSLMFNQLYTEKSSPFQKKAFILVKDTVYTFRQSYLNYYIFNFGIFNSFLAGLGRNAIE